jgi:octaprenyl-diphosphate synthase
MNQSLRKIKLLLMEDIKLYEQTLNNILLSNIGIIDRIVKYLVRFKGKGLRPLLVLISARLLGNPTNNTYVIASVVELLHTATLIHDDVVDNSQMRRKFPSINAVWKNKVSVLMGDYLLSKSLIGASQTENLRVIEVLADTSRRMSRGELYQIEKSRKLNITEEEYYKLISDKTASLFSASCKLGAISVNSKSDECKNIGLFGENLGIAFQIKDDLLDYQGHQKIIGKPSKTDIRQKNITLPLLLAFNNSSQKEKKQIIGLLKKGADNKDIKAIVDYCKVNGGLQSAQEKVIEYAGYAKEYIGHFPDNRYKEIACMLVDYIIDRKK